MAYILNGWISPNGEIFPCGFMEHRNAALEIAEREGFRIDPTNYFYSGMWERGYLNFSGYPDCPDPEIDFSNNPDIELTEAQKMAQARLIKQFYHSEG
jgi:hypothetical protein